MDEITAVAAAETISVLYNTENSLVSKIPYAIIKALEDKALECKEEIKLNMNLSLYEQSISEEAQVILLMIYKNYWCDKEKQQQMNTVLLQKSAEYDKEQVDNSQVLKDNNQENINNEVKGAQNSEPIDNQKAITINSKKWYVRIFERVVRFFRKK